MVGGIKSEQWAGSAGISKYLARAEDADLEASRTREPEMTERWKRIAEDYRALAALIVRKPNQAW
jgi:hypothetical protein